MGLGAKLALLFAGVAATTTLLVGGVSYVTTDREVENSIDRFLTEQVELIRNGDRRGDGRRRDRDGQDLDSFGVGSEAEVQFLDGKGNIISNSGLLLPVNDGDRQVAERAEPTTIRTVTLDGEDYRMITANLQGSGAVQVARSLDEATGLVDVLQTRQIVVALTVALVGAALGWVVAQRTTQPLRALSRAVDEVAQTQDFTVPVSAGGRDEIGRLARGFDRMLHALHQSREQQHRLVQDAAHELRTPLTSITANVEWLMHADQLDPATRSDTLAGVRRELNELNDVIAEIIELATDSHAAPALAPIDLATVARDAVELFRGRSSRPVELTTTPTPVDGDPEALGRAVANLITNADKYSPPDAPISVTVSSGGVFVGDAGPGIPDDERDRVFERFHRRDIDRSKPGSGLGLSIVAGIVSAHGGETSISTSPLGGALVGFTLPMATHGE